MNEPTAFVDNIELVLRSSQVAANWGTGMDYGASNAPGIGIATDNPGLDQSLPSWTRLDQDGDARSPQVGQIIGGGGGTGNPGKGLEAIEVVTNGDGDGEPASLEQAELNLLATGWVSAAP
ncbi:MAG: hypothetical protein GY703_24775 [Gammaproteobacteria bacterium]|nr:hypothetical protein [Gammaproteobacteria bacterium]MCP4466814.1 hypothetical protein [Halieaceae bacterium]